MTLLIKGTRSTPDIDFDVENKIFKISGISFPEDPYLFYDKIFDYLEKVSSTDNTFIISLDYFNTLSAKVLLDMFRLMSKKGKVIWYSCHDDEDLIETGEDFKWLIGDNFDTKIKNR